MNKLKELRLNDKKIKLIISKNLQSEILYLHNVVGDIEWSGPVFYKVISGDINCPESLVLKAECLFPYNVGTSSYTEYEFGPEIIDLYVNNPETKNMKWGNIHTHHTMNTFFSGTDMQELHDNAESHNYYLSLIVNHKTQYCAKVAFVADFIKPSGTNKLKFKGTSGKGDEIILNEEESINEKILVLIDCDIELETSDFFKKRVQEVNSKKSNYNYYTGGGYNHYPNSNKSNSNYGKQLSFDNYDKEFDFKPSKKINNIIVHDKTPFDKLEVITFLVKWLSEDMLCEDKLSDVIRNLNKTTRGKNLDSYIDNIDRTLKDTFFSVWTVNPSVDDLSDLAESCISQLQNFKHQYSVVEDIINLLDLYVLDYETPDYINDKKQWIH